MKSLVKNTLLIINIFFVVASVYAQPNKLIIGDGAKLQIEMGCKLIADVILIGDNSTFFSEDSSCIGKGTVISSGDDKVLPVGLCSFMVKLENNKAVISWKTSTEVNNAGFEIEKAVAINEESNWRVIGFVSGIGNSTSNNDYFFIDEEAWENDRLYYRIRQIDFNGSSYYSDIVEAYMNPQKFALYQNYPNPFNPSTKIKYQISENSNVQIKVYDILGEEISELVNELKTPGIYEAEFNAKNFPSGTYFYKISCNDFSEVKKMLLVK